MKVLVSGYGTATCLSQGGATQRLKQMNPLNWVERAYNGNGYIGLSLETGEIVEHPSPTAIKLYEIPRDSKLPLQDLRNRFVQNWQRLKIDIKDRIESFYNQNCIIVG